MIKNGLPPIHPGEFLAETLEELGLSQAQFARAIGVSPMRISHVINGTRPVTAELALLFSRALDQSPQYWLNLQTDYDLKATEVTIRKQYRLLPDWPRLTCASYHPVAANASARESRKAHCLPWRCHPTDGAFSGSLKQINE